MEKTKMSYEIPAAEELTVRFEENILSQITPTPVDQNDEPYY